MLSFFPTPYPDESFYSIIARYHMYVGNIKVKHTILDLFSVDNRISRWDIPTHLEVLINQIPGGIYSSEDLIYNHTNFPYYSAFISEDNHSDLIKYIVEGDSRVISKMGINKNAGGAHNESLQHCKFCIEEDIETYGETYWHRIHQVPGVLICPRHNEPLLSSDKLKTDYVKTDLIMATKELFEGAKPKNYEPNILELLQTYAREVEWLLAKKVSKPKDFYRNCYINILKQKKLCTFRGRSNHIEIYHQFLNYYNQNILSLMNVDVTNTSHCWLRNMVRNFYHKEHPIKHILFIIWLCGGLKEFYSNDHTFYPFGKGPWPCLNPAHSSYQKLVVNKLTISEPKVGKITGKFTCNCGYVYTRTIMNNHQSSMKEKSKTIEFGEVWKKELFKLYNKGDNIHLIARKLKTAPLTIKRYLSLDKKGPVLAESNGISTKVEKDLYNMKNQWLKLIKKYPDFTRTELQRNNRALYSRLFRYDKQWLLENTPNKKKYDRKRNHINWVEVDQKLLREAREIVTNWGDFESIKLQRVTKSFIAFKTTKPNAFFDHPDKIPKTMEFVKSISESVEQFQIRRLKKIAKNEERVNKTKILIKAGISKPTAAIEDFVNKLIEEQGSTN